MKRRMHAALLSVLALVLGSGALALTTAGPAGADDSGTVTLTPASGSVDDNPPLTQLTLSNGCPEGYQDSIEIGVVLTGGTSDIVYGLTDGAPYSGTNVTVTVPADPGPTTYINSIADAFGNFGATPADGTYPLNVMCESSTGASVGTSTFSTLIDITGHDWAVKQVAPPATTSVTLSVSPASHSVTDQAFTVSATVTPSDAAGTVQFLQGPINLGAPQTVANGTASLAVPGVPANVYDLSAVFTPTDPTKYAGSNSPVVAYHVLAEPDITVLDKDNNTLEDTPLLKGGQKITVTLAGFQNSPDNTPGEVVHLKLDDGSSALPDATANSTGAVTNLAVTLPSTLADGCHTLDFTGATSAVKQSFPFKSGADSDDCSGGSGDTAGSGDTSGTGDTAGSGDISGTGDTAGTGDTSGTGDTAGTGDTSGTGGTSGGTGGTGASGGSSGGSNLGPLAATGAGGALTYSVLSLLMVGAGGFMVYRVRRDGKLLTFGSGPRD